MNKLLRKSAKKQTVVNVRTTGKWIERISQSKQTLHEGYVIKYLNMIASYD